MSMIGFLLLMPLCSGLAVLVVRRQRFNKPLLLLTALAHFGVTAGFWKRFPEPMLDGWLRLDPIGLLFLSAASLLFVGAAAYSMTYLRRHVEPRAGRTDAPFIATLLLFLSAMTLVTVCQQFELLWVAIEATTLASAPLIYFHRNRHSLEATWKYLIICSVGIALSLMGNYFLSIGASAASSSSIPGLPPGHGTLLLSELISAGPRMQPGQLVWLRTAFIFLFVGYGTKMGLAPLHTWLPDAHSEAPSLVSALLSGALLNCAFVGILRGYQVCAAAGQGGFVQTLLVAFGLLSMAFAAAFVLRQTDFKRMLAYSSVEHMGILSLSVGLGGTAVFGGLFHAMNHSLTKGLLFFAAGNVYEAYKSRSTAVVRGVSRLLPWTGVLWFVGLFAISGSPPFGLFVSEFTILKASVDQGRYAVAALFLLSLGVVFIGMTIIMLRMLLGTHEHAGQHGGEIGAAQAVESAETFWTIAPAVVMAALVLLLGLHIPPVMVRYLHEAAASLGGR